MLPKATLALSCPLESVRPPGGSKLTPAGPLNSTSAPVTALPWSSLTCTTSGWASTMPVAPICLPPLDSTSAAPKLVGFRAEAAPVLRAHPALTRARETTKSVRQCLHMLFLRPLLCGALLRHQECGQRAGIFVAHAAVRLDDAGPHGLRVLQPVVNPRGIQARADLCERGSDVAFVDLGIDDVASLAGILGIEKLFPLLHLCGRIAAGRHGIAVECRSLIRGHDVVGQFLRVVIGNVESRHAADQRRTQRAGVLQERLQPLTLHRTAFPGEVGSQVAATAIDGVASEASHVRHEPSSLARGLVIRRRLDRKSTR